LASPSFFEILARAASLFGSEIPFDAALSLFSRSVAAVSA